MGTRDVRRFFARLLLPAVTIATCSTSARSRARGCRDTRCAPGRRSVGRRTRNHPPRRPFGGAVLLRPEGISVAPRCRSGVRREPDRSESLLRRAGQMVKPNVIFQTKPNPSAPRPAMTTETASQGPSDKDKSDKDKKDYQPPRGATHKVAWASDSGHAADIEVIAEWILLRKKEHPAAELFYTYYRLAEA